MIDCLFKSLAPATAKKAKKQNMVKLHQSGVARQLCSTRTGWCAWLPLPARGPPCHKGCLGACLPACLAAGAEIVSYLPALASTLSFSLAHYCPRLGAIKNRVTYQKMKKKIFWCLTLYKYYIILYKSNTFWRWCHHGLGKVWAEGMAHF